MKYVLPSNSYVSYDSLVIPPSVSITTNTSASIYDSLGRLASSDLKIKFYGDIPYVPWVTPEKSGPYLLKLQDNGFEVYKTYFYVLNDNEARHTPGSITIPHPFPPVFFSGEPLFPDSISIALKTNFGLPTDPYSINYQFITSTLIPLTPISNPARSDIGKYYVPGTLNLPGGDHLVRWTWQVSEDAPLHSIDKPVSVINYNSYSTSPGVCSGSVGYVCCSSSPCKCLSNC